MNKLHINYKGFWSMLALMFGFTIFSASVMSGGNLADHMTVINGILAIVLGNIFLALYGGAIAYISKKRNANLDGVLRKSYGKLGAIVPSMVMVVTQIGWIGVGIAMVAKPIASALDVSPWALVFPVAIAIICTAFFGIKSLTILSIIAVPLVMILGFTTIGIASSENSVIPANSITIGLWSGISIVIGTFISGATFVPNFAVNADTPKNAVASTIFAFLVGNGMMITFGFVGGLLYTDTVFDFVSVAKKQGFMIVGLIILILNIWTTNDSGLYSVSLGMKNWFKIPKRLSVVIFGLIAAAASLYLFDHFINFLSMMNAFVPAIGGILMATYFLRKKDRVFRWKGIDIAQVIIWGLSSGLTFIPALKPYAPIIAFAISISASSIAVLFENYIAAKRI